MGALILSLLMLAVILPTPAAHAADLTVHDLIAEPKVPPQYGDFTLKTNGNIDLDQITDASNLTVRKGDDGYTLWYPNTKGATITVRHVGEWLGGDNQKHWVNARYTVVDSHSTCFYQTSQKRIFGVHSDATSDGNAFMEYTVDFTLDDGGTPTGFRGVTGFTDLDYYPQTGGGEGVELIDGFDSAYVRSDAHLKRFGTNGWRATTDENYDYGGGVHAMQHYVGATFVGPHLHLKYSNTSRMSYDMQFDPVQAQTAYRLIYDPNGAQSGNTPQQTN